MPTFELGTAILSGQAVGERERLSKYSWVAPLEAGRG